MIYQIKITETREKIETIRAESLKEAIEKIDDDYCNKKISLKNKNIIDVKFEEY